jgi:hypothetical protein
METSSANSSEKIATLVTFKMDMDDENENEAAHNQQNNLISANTVTLDTATPSTKFQKIVLEDISAEEYFKEQTEESTCKIYHFKITNDELKIMIENSILETATTKPYRYLTGNFIRVFEKQVEIFEKTKISIQKRNNIVYEESARNNTVYLRINGDCKLCPKSNRVKYVFTVKTKPKDTDEFVLVETKCRGIHNHNHGNNNNNSPGTPNTSVTHSHTPKSTTVNRSSLPTSNAALSYNHNHVASLASTTPNERVVVLTKKRKIEEDYSVNMSGGNGSPPAKTMSLNDKNALNHIVNQISSKIMIKLDQINLKLNQISDRLFDLERKFETIEVAELI